MVNPLVRKGIVSGLVGALFAASVPVVRAQESPVSLSETAGTLDSSPAPDLSPNLMPVAPFQSVLSSDSAMKCTEPVICHQEAEKRFEEGDFIRAAALFLQSYDLISNISYYDSKRKSTPPRLELLIGSH